MGDPPALRPFRFGVQLAGLYTGREWRDQARRAESAGYHVVTVPDHLAADGMVGAQLATIPALQAALDATTTLRAGALVLGNDYRHPAILAKELATLDVLSDGRLEIGLGAGWMTVDYEQIGLPLDTPATRIERLEEALDVIEGCLSPGPFSFDGRHYRIDGHDALPRPVQTPRPPLLIGGGGRRLLSVAARRADIVGINGTLREGVFGPGALESMTADAVTAKLDIVREAAGDRFPHVELHIRTFFVAVTDQPAEHIDRLSRSIGVDPVVIEESPFALIGSAAGIVETLLERRERFGFTYVTVGAAEIDEMAPVVAELAGR